MPYKIPNTFNAQTPLGQSVQNLMQSYFGNLPTPADTAKAEYMRSGTEAANANAALNRQKYEANAGAQTVYENIINNPEGLDPQEAMVKNLAAYMANQQQSGNIGTAGKSILAIAPWMRGNTPETVNKAQLGSGMATGSTIEGTLQGEMFDTQRAGMRGRKGSSGGGGVGEADDMTPGERQILLKQRLKESTGNKAVQTMNSTLDSLSGLYGELQKSGDIVSVDNSPLKNVKNYLASTDIGQMAGQAIGTPAQSKRNEIEALLPQVMFSLMAASGLTAKQLDSNADVKFIKQAITNPKVDYDAVFNTIERLRQRYGVQGSLPSASVMQPSSIVGAGAGAGAAQAVFDDLPDPAQFEGQIIDNPETGESFISNGTEWVAQ